MKLHSINKGFKKRLDFTDVSLFLHTSVIDINNNQFEEISIPVPWGHIAGRWYGKKNVRPILALHGWLDNYGTWNTLIPLMPPHIGVLVIDMAGHGKSSRLPEGIFYHNLNYVADIIRVIRHYKWDKVSIMAHSMSAMLAFVFAAFYPDQVDILIQLDSFHPQIHSPERNILKIGFFIENFLLEEKRIREQNLKEPPSYPIEEVIQRVHKGSNNSVDVDKCAHIIQTNVTKSKLYPSKYYFSRDPRLKSYLGFHAPIDFILVMSKRIKIPQIVIKASRSDFIDDDDPLIEALRDSNPYFEFHILQGTHHLHLNNAPETSILVNAFINKWRPHVDDNVPDADEVKPQPQICPMKPQSWNLQKAKL